MSASSKVAQASDLASPVARTHGQLSLRRPRSGDGAAVHELIARCPPLDANSLYCNLLHCSLFSSTAVLAESATGVQGFISACIEPDDPACVFVWQVAVAPEARGRGLGVRMLFGLLDLPACAQVSRLRTTITPSNLASWALFESLGLRLGARVERRPWFDRERHFAGRHDSEMLLTIAPINAAALARARTDTDGGQG